MVVIPDFYPVEALFYKLSFFKKVARAGGRTWDLFDFRLFSLSIAVP